jgi:DNA-binding NtrC family response regulator
MRCDLSILIVDDDPGALRLLETILTGARYRTRTAGGPLEALRLVAAEPPDLLITDLRMPDMSGVELLRAVQTRLPGLCCLIITGFASDEAVEEAFAAGAQDILAKPVHVTEVLARVERAAELVRLRQEVRRLRATATGSEGPAGAVARARELGALVALPGRAPPPILTFREEIAQRLEVLTALHRYGGLSPTELEEKRRAILDHG